VKKNSQALGNTRLEYRLMLTGCQLKSIQTSVGPEYNIIFIRITPTLKEVEKQMSSFNINIPSERSGNNIFQKNVDIQTITKAHWTVVSQNDDFLTLTLYRGKKG
jgi:hypothetical protein